MNSKLLTFLVIFVASLQIGCGKDKPTKQQKAMINACMYDPSGQCQQRAKSILEGRGIQEQLAGQPVTPPPATTPPGTTPPATPPPVAGKPDSNLPPVILPATLKAQALKVQAQLEADSRNPRSLYYDPPAGSSVVDRTPAAEQNAPAQASALVNPGLSPASSAGADAFR